MAQKINGRVYREPQAPAVEHVGTLVTCTVYCRHGSSAVKVRQLTLGIDSNYEIGKPRSAIYFAQYINEKAVEEVMKSPEIEGDFSGNPDDFYTVVDSIFTL